MSIEELKNDKLTLHIITHLILEYRTSLSTICKIYKLDENDAYEALMSNRDSTLKKALIYVLDYETKEGITDQDVARRKTMAFLTKLHILKDKKEKLELIKSISDDSDVINLQNKTTAQLDASDFEKIIKYRYKYAISRKELEREIGINEDVLRKREDALTGDMKIKIEHLNRYYDYNNNNYNSSYRSIIK